MNKLKSIAISVLNAILPGALKTSAFHLAYHLAPAEFEKFAHDYAAAPNMRLRLAELARRGFTPSTVVDVGAFEGEWSKLARQVWPGCALVMIEPNLASLSQTKAVASELGAQVFCELLGAEDGRSVEFSLLGAGSSILDERGVQAPAKEARQLRRLDSLLGRVDSPALIKVDAQGYELEILRGASKLMPAFDVVLLEMSVIEMNIGAPLLHDVVSFMKQLGYLVYDIVEFHRRPVDKTLFQVDMIFTREQSFLFADKKYI